MHVIGQPTAVRTVGLHIVIPADARDGSETVRLSHIKSNLEFLIGHNLERLGGIEVKIKPSSSQPPKAGSGLDPWLQDSGVQYYLTGEVTPSLGDERSFAWRLRDVRATGAKTWSGAPASDDHVHLISSVDDRRAREDVRQAALRVRDEVARRFGIGRTKRILVSCFQITSLPSPTADRAVLQQLEAGISHSLAARLIAVLGTENYETSFLAPAEIEEFCKSQGGTPPRSRLEDRKGRADCVIEGMIRMSTAEFVEITFTASWRRVPVRIEPLRERISEQRILQVIGDHIVERWKQIERVR